MYKMIVGKTMMKKKKSINMHFRTEVYVKMKYLKKKNKKPKSTNAASVCLAKFSTLSWNLFFFVVVFVGFNVHKLEALTQLEFMHE